MSKTKNFDQTITPLLSDNLKIKLSEWIIIAKSHLAKLNLGRDDVLYSLHPDMEEFCSNINKDLVDQFRNNSLPIKNEAPISVRDLFIIKKKSIKKIPKIKDKIKNLPCSERIKEFLLREPNSTHEILDRLFNIKQDRLKALSILKNSTRGMYRQCLTEKTSTPNEFFKRLLLIPKSDDIKTVMKIINFIVSGSSIEKKKDLKSFINTNMPKFDLLFEVFKNEDFQRYLRIRFLQKTSNDSVVTELAQHAISFHDSELGLSEDLYNKTLDKIQARLLHTPKK